MTTRELRNDVSMLCSTDIGEKDRQFIAYANLALGSIYSELPVIRNKELYTSSLLPSSYTERIVHKGGEELTVPMEGRAFSLIAVGRGRITVKDKNGIHHTDFDTEETAFRGFLSSPASLTLSGEYSFTVYSLSVYSEIVSDNECDILVFSDKESFDLPRLLPDFGELNDSPKDERGAPIQSAEYSGGILTLDTEGIRKFTVEYKRIPKRLLVDSPDEPIDITGDCYPLLVSLCAYYKAMEDESEVSEAHLLRYKELLEALKASRRKESRVEYIDTNGWA